MTELPAYRLDWRMMAVCGGKESGGSGERAVRGYEGGRLGGGGGATAISQTCVGKSLAQDASYPLILSAAYPHTVMSGKTVLRVHRVCVCVCVWRERERGRGRERERAYFKQLTNQLRLISAERLPCNS